MALFDKTMTVGIAGVGSAGCATAAYLDQSGHAVILWSPSGASTRAFAAGAPLVAHKAIEASFHPGVARDAADLVRRSDVIVLALPGYGHKAVLDAIAPHLRADQAVIFSSHASFEALYLGSKLAERGISLPMVAWSTTLATAKKADATSVNVNTLRSKIDMATVPESRTDDGMRLCRALFGDRFVQRDGLLSIAISNLNPQNHMGIALCNMTRMEHGETWGQGANITPNVGRLLEQLDAERLAIAEVLGLQVRTIFDHFHFSYHVPRASISEMNQVMHLQGIGGVGPATADSRYATEDVPYGLHATAVLADLVGRPATLHRAGVQIFSALYGRDFASENTLLSEMAFDTLTLEQLKKACVTGVLPARRTEAA